jgi:hypothetical protein
MRQTKEENNIWIIETSTLEEALSFLQDLNIKDSSNKFIFRGHSEAKWKIKSTIKRYFKASVVNPSELIERFKVGLARIGLYPNDIQTNLEWLQYARHSGIPTPVIDFTYSPYIALFFAFHGIMPKYALRRDNETFIDDDFVALCILDVSKLAGAYASYLTDYSIFRMEKKITDASDEERKQYWEFFNKKYHDFLNRDLVKYFEKGFIANALQLIPYPSKSNIRMLKQQGVLLYDTLLKGYAGEINQWEVSEWEDLEDWIKNAPNPPTVMPNGSEEIEPILYKLKISKNEASKAFNLLDLMNINAASLFGTPDAVAKDVINAFYFNPKMERVI